MTIPPGVLAAVDRVKPNVSITNPTQSGAYNGTITIQASATDNDQIAGVQFYVDGSPFGAEDTVAPYQVSLNTASLSTGNHTCSAVARDRLGNTQQSSVITFRANDQHPPSVGFYQPGNGATVTGNLTFWANVSDDVGIAYVQFRIDGGGWTGAIGSPYQWTIDTHNLTRNWHTVECLATDTSNNQTLSGAVSFFVGNNPPPAGHILDSAYIHNDAQYADRWVIDYAPNWFPEGGRFDQEAAYLPGNSNPTYYQMRVRFFSTRIESPQPGRYQHLWAWVNRTWQSGNPDWEVINTQYHGEINAYGPYFNVNGGERIEIQRSGDAQDGCYTQGVQCQYDFTNKYAS